MSRLIPLVVVPALLLAAACGGDPDVVESKTSGASSSSKSAKPEKEQGQLVDAGFGQDGEYAMVGALVKNTSDKAGQTVTVQWNLLNQAGDVISTTEQVSHFAWPGQDLAVVTQAEAPEKAVKVEATLLVEDDDTFADATSDDLGSTDAKLVKGEYGGMVAQVALTNPLTTVLKDPGIQVLCFDVAGKIAGAGFTYAELIGASGKFRQDVDVMVGSAAKSCKGYLEPSVLS